MNRMYGNIQRVSSVASANLAGCPTKPVAIAHTSSGAPAIPANETANRIQNKADETFDSRILVRASPSRACVSLKIGTKACEIAPSANRRRSRLGRRNATLNASMSAPAPKPRARITSRARPRMRDTSVQLLTVAAARRRFTIVWLAGVGSMADRFDGDAVALGAAGSGLVRAFQRVAVWRDVAGVNYVRIGPRRPNGPLRDHRGTTAVPPHDHRTTTAGPPQTTPGATLTCGVASASLAACQVAWPDRHCRNVRSGRQRQKCRTRPALRLKLDARRSRRREPNWVKCSTSLSSYLSRITFQWLIPSRLASAPAKRWYATFITRRFVRRCVQPSNRCARPLLPATMRPSRQCFATQPGSSTTPRTIRPYIRIPQPAT